MTTIDALILGIVQGITEFLPISSSGHLHLFEYFLGLKDLDRYILFDLACHLGTLLAIFLMFSRSIKSTMLNKKLFLQIFIGTLPLVPLVFLMKSIKAIYADPSYLGLFFLLTSLILFLGIYLGKTVSFIEREKHHWRDAFCIGLWQAMAILPGVSRSGATISGARLLGWNATDAVTFSFLLAIPTILGGSILEFFNWLKHPENFAQLSFKHYLVGFFVSFLMGLIALKVLFFVAKHNKFTYFAWYCLFLGIAITYYFRYT